MSGVEGILSGVEGIVFDLDGTLVDSFRDLQVAVNHARHLRSMPPLPIEAVKEHVGRGVRRLVAGTIAPDGNPGFDDALRDFRDYYKAHSADETRPYPGVAEALMALSRRPMAVLSNKPESLARDVIDSLGLSPFFKAVFGGDSFPAMKPDPQALLGALSAIGVEPARALMVGDTDVDVAAAREVGARVVLVRTGLWETCVREPDAFVDDLCDLPNLLTEPESE